MEGNVKTYKHVEILICFRLLNRSEPLDLFTMVKKMTGKDKEINKGKQ